MLAVQLRISNFGEVEAKMNCWKIREILDILYHTCYCIWIL